MKQINYNAETRETTVEEVADVEIPVTPTTSEPTVEERVAALETLVLELGGII